VRHADLVPLFENEEKCFHSEYQQIVELAEGNIIGYEALLRAETLDGNRVMPDELFPAAEAAGWIHLLDRVGRTTALRDAGSWIGNELLFINFIPTSIYRPEVCLRTTEIAAREAGVRLDQLVFEVTEGHRVDSVSHLERVFDYYRSRNCKVALDDLGAGYSSLNLLIRLRPDVVKLDKEIVQDLPGPIGSAVVAAIVDIVHSYGGLVLAECIETSDQAEAATQLGVDLGQGWLFGRPERRATDSASDPTDRIVPGRVQPHYPDGPVRIPAPRGGQHDTEDQPVSSPESEQRMIEQSASMTSGSVNTF
jgi:EAL domain-containing protein (putative c-di-GMP-specific phosphodiesterase class I)